jgi:hypothetical protein
MNDLGAGKAPPGFAWDQWPDWVERAPCILQPEGSPKEYFENWLRMIAEPESTDFSWDANTGTGADYSERHKKGVMQGAGRCSLRAATPPTGGVNAPNDVKHVKAGTETMSVGEAFLGGCPGRL